MGVGSTPETKSATRKQQQRDRRQQQHDRSNAPWSLLIVTGWEPSSFRAGDHPPGRD